MLCFFYMAPGGGLGTVVVPEIVCAMYWVVGGTTGTCWDMCLGIRRGDTTLVKACRRRNPASRSCIIIENQRKPWISIGFLWFWLIFIDFWWFSLILDEFLIYWGGVGDPRDLNAPRQRPLMPKRMSQHAPVVPPTNQYTAQPISGTTTVPRPPPGVM